MVSYNILSTENVLSHRRISADFARLISEHLQQDTPAETSSGESFTSSSFSQLQGMANSLVIKFVVSMMVCVFCLF